MRLGSWKLIEFFEDMRCELYNLDNDPGEAFDLSASMPEKTAELRNLLHAWRDSIQAKIPQPNPDWKPGI